VALFFFFLLRSRARTALVRMAANHRPPLPGSLLLLVAPSTPASRPPQSATAASASAFALHRRTSELPWTTPAAARLSHRRLLP